MKKSVYIFVLVVIVLFLANLAVLDANYFSRQKNKPLVSVPLLSGPTLAVVPFSSPQPEATSKTVDVPSLDRAYFEAFIKTKYGEILV